MSARTILIAVLALTFGGSAAVGVNLLYNQAPSAPAETTAVVVAADDIGRGTLITPDLVTIRQFPKDLVPLGAMNRVEDVLDRVAFHPLVKDETLLETMLSAKNAKGGLAGIVPKGMRAFTILTPQVASSVGGFILPGNKVDVLFTMSSNNANDITGGAVTTTLLQNVEILAVDQRLDAPSENKVDPKGLQSVTLLVTPDQAAKLELGQNKGSLHLTLRNPEDSDAAKTQPATLSGLQFYQEKPWTERAKELIEAIGKLKTEKKASTPSEASADGPAPILEIRTVRNVYSGVVQLEELSDKPRKR
jgi:pilus assembly protein CpaB